MIVKRIYTFELSRLHGLVVEKIQKDYFNIF